MNTHKLNNHGPAGVNGNAADRSAGIDGTVGANNNVSFPTKTTKVNDYSKKSFTGRSGFSLSLLGLKSNYNEY